MSELRGAVQLAAQATRGVAAVVEGVHASVWRTLGANGTSPERTRGLTGLVYRSIHGASHVVERGADRALAELQSRLDQDHDADHPSPQRLAFLSILNGVLGDHLVASGNPLALPMTLRHRGALPPADSPATMPAPSRHLLLFVHGLCMNDLQWRGERDGEIVDHAETLAQSLGATTLHLRYNTGQHIAQNGRELSAQLERLVAQWPVPVERISIVAHSMGGLVARSACHHGEVDAMRWRRCVRDLVFLGVPHHGAPLERAGAWVDQLLARTMYSAPFAKLGQMRSAGITDLRHGKVRDDGRLPLPLPAGVACFSVAATLAQRRGALAERLVGDGLVPLDSALGRHHEAARDLGLSRLPHWISHGTGHIELLHRPEVGAWIADQLRAC
jgi:pimeloyl-ACP methyl ester carboxylesterase